MSNEYEKKESMSNELEQTWKDEYDRLWRVTGVGLVLKPTLKMFIESLLSKQRASVVEKVEGLKKDRPHEIPFDNYHERMSGVIGNNQALDQVLSIIKEKE